MNFNFDENLANMPNLLNLAGKISQIMRIFPNLPAQFEFRQNSITRTFNHMFDFVDAQILSN